MLDLAHLPADFLDNPFPYYDRLLQDAPVCMQADGSVILSRHADLERVYKDTGRFISDKRAVFAPKFGQGTPLFEHHTTSLVFNDPPLHTRVRRIMTAALAPRAIQRMEAGLIRVVDELLDGMSGEVDLVSDYAMAIPIQIIGNLLDIPHDERGPLRGWSLAILGALEPVLSPEQLEKGHAAVTAFADYLRALIAQRRAAPGDPETDVLTRLIAGDPDGSLSEIELIQNCIFILNAGHETTTNLIGSGLALLHDHPVEKQRLSDEPTLIATAVEEVLRLASPNQFGNRETAETVEFRGRNVPKGTNLHLCIGAANRDPEAFEAPEVFQPNRQPNKHLAFGSGAHTCVGLTLARMEGQVALQQFLKRFPTYRIDEGAIRSNRIRFRGFTSLPVRLRP